MEKRESISQVTNEDCMELMSRYPDKYFELAIVDPPYGIGFDGEVSTMVTNNASGKWNGARGKIIWGGNYFKLPNSGGWIVWDKKRPEDFSLSQAELAWVKNSGRISVFRYLWNGFQKEKPEERFHPTQKPVKLYEWILKNYASEGDKILDTHLGSGSSRIAADKMGFDFYACELDRDYFEAQEKRFKEYKSQLILF